MPNRYLKLNYIIYMKVRNIMAEEQVKSPEKILLEIKANTVPKVEFDELSTKYKKLFEAAANGLTVPQEDKPLTEAEKRANFVAATKELNEPGKSSLSHMKNLLVVDEYLTSHGHRSAFAPSKGDMDDSTEKSCQAVRDLIQASIDNSDGSSEVASAFFANHISTVR